MEVHYTDEALNGVYYWIDNTVFPGNTAPEPNKGLFVGKLGAYIKFPAIAGKTLTEVTYTPTTSQSGDVKLDLMGSDGEEISYDNPAPLTTYTLIEPAENTAYRLQIINSKNAQIAKIELTYEEAE